MKISILCQFEEETACGIHMRGKSRGLAELGHAVCLIYHPFKYRDYNEKKTITENGYRATRLFPRVFQKNISFPKKIIWALSFFIWDVPRVWWLLWRSEVVIWHKPLPLALFYQLLLKATFFSGKSLCLLDDWEGVGGMATVRNAGNLWNKMLVTLSDEWLPELSRGIICSSQLSVDKMELSPKTASKVIYIPLGASIIREKKMGPPESEGFSVCYVGTFKSKWLIDFLLSVISMACQRNKEIRFQIIGGGEDFLYLEDQVLRLEAPDRIKLWGQIPHAEVMNHLYQSSVCLLILNDKFPENYMDASRSSTKMFEYMAMGKAILAPRFGEPANVIISEKTGYLVENNPAAFVEKILELAKRPGDLIKMAPVILKHFEENYSHQALMKKMSAWMSSL